VTTVVAEPDGVVGTEVETPVVSVEEFDVVLEYPGEERAVRECGQAILVLHLGTLTTTGCVLVLVGTLLVVITLGFLSGGIGGIIAILA